MSLKVWLPLNGDLHNQGISDLNTINMPSSAAVDNTGKIGKCYTSSGAASGVSTNLNFSASQFSIAAWVRINTRVNSWRCPFKLINSTAGDYIGFCCEHNTQATYVGFHFYKTIDGTNTSIFDAYPVTDMTVGVWTHLAVTYDGKVATYYKNGIKVSSTTIATAKQNTIAKIDRIIMLGSDGGRGGAAVKSSLNDIRVYDHCLSAAEVREIAQGLILHYKLDDAIGFTDLIARNVNVNAYNNHGNTNNPTTITYLSQQYNGDRIIQYSATPNSSVISSIQTSLYSHGIYNWNRTFKANTKYVFWIYYKPITHLDTIAGGTASNIGGWTEIPPVAVGNGWYRVGQYRNGTVTTDKTDNIFVSYKTPSAIAGDNIIIYFASPHLLEGTTEIPPYDYPSTIIQDSSGYNHNGTIIGDLMLISNSQRYSTATKWNCSDPTTNNNTGLCYIQTPLTLTTPLQMSITWWAKPESGYGGSTSHAAFCTSNNTSAPTDYNTTAFHHRDSGFDIYPSDGSGVKRLSFTYTKNEWHHYAVTYDGTTARAYQDGVLKTSIEVGANKTLASFSQLYIGFSKAGGVWRKTLGSYSDFRVYVTQLLDTDIKQLYNVGMKIDKSHNIHTYELHQKDENKLHKTGVLCNSNFNEINNLFNLLYDKQLYIEPDGSCWIRIFHHANCDTKLFASSDTFTTSVYKDADRWFNVSLCNKVNKWELMVKSMPTTGGTETKYRWIQTKNPMTAAYADVAAASVTKVTGNGYASYGWGGLYHIGSSTYLATNNGTNGNWWGAVGAWAHHQSGIPGWTTVITTGYEDVYLRIDNLNQVNLHVKNIKAGMWTANQFIEK